MFAEPCMRTMVPGLLALAVALAPAPAVQGPARADGPQALTPAQQKRLQERDRYEEEAVRLLQTGKAAEAAAVLEKQLAVNREVFGDRHEEVITSLKRLAKLYERLEDFGAARKARREIRATLTNVYGQTNWRVADARRELEDTDLLARLDATRRRQLWQAAKLAVAADRLSGRGRLHEALELAGKVAEVKRQILGEKHQGYAASLFSLAELHKRSNDYAEAEACFRQALAIYKQALGEEHPAYADGLRLLAMTYHASGEYAKAEPLLRQAVEIMKRTLGVEDLNYTITLNYLARLYQATGEYAKAEPLLRQILASYKHELGEKHPLYGNNLIILAGVYQSMGDDARAERLYRQVLAIRKQTLGEKHPDYAGSLNNLAVLYLARGEYAKAAPLLRQSLAILKQARGDTHREYAAALNNLALTYKDAGNYAEAEPLFRRALEITKQALGENNPDYVRFLGNMAQLHQWTGDYARAEPLFRRALDISRQARRQEPAAYATALNNLAYLYLYMQDYFRAEPLFRQALEILEKTPGETVNYAAGLDNLGQLYRAMGDYAEAEALYRRALAIKKRVLGESHPHYAMSLNNLADLEYLAGDYARAEALARRAAEINKQTLGEKHPGYATTLDTQAVMSVALGEYAKAERLYRQALDIKKQTLGDRHPGYATTLTNRARLFRSMGKPTQAALDLERALSVNQAFVDNTLTAMSDRQRLEFLPDYRGSLDAYLSVAPEAGVSAGRCYERVLALKGALAARQAEERAGRDRPELRPLARRLRQAQAALAQWARTPPAGPEQQAAWLRRFGELEAAKEALEAELAQESARYRGFRGLRRATAEQVAKALPPGTALVDFLEYVHGTPPPEHKGRFRPENRLLAFVLARGREPACVNLGPAEPVERAVQEWRRAVVRGDPPKAAGEELRRRVWAPLRHHLAGAFTVLVAPDGPLCGLPFAALPGERPGSYLIEELAVGYVTSGRHLLELAARADGPPGHGLLAVGGLAYGDPPDAAALAGASRRPVWKDLPGAALEVERVAQIFRAAFPREEAPRRLTGNEADAPRLKRELPTAAGAARPRYLHLATHGFFEDPPPDSPVRPGHAAGGVISFAEAREYITYGRNPLLLSGVVLAGANRSPEAGILTAEEVAGLDLRGAELVVLSACETGLGRVAGGEGVLGLERAFQAAEARALVASLWSVSDAATSALMEEFYANLWQRKLPKLQALRQAQLTVLRQPGRVARRAAELRGALVARGVPEPALAARGLGKEAADLPAGGGPGPTRSPPAWWAAFVLSGDGR